MEHQTVYGILCDTLKAEECEKSNNQEKYLKCKAMIMTAMETTLAAVKKDLPGYDSMHVIEEIEYSDTPFSTRKIIIHIVSLFTKMMPIRTSWEVRSDNLSLAALKDYRFDVHDDEYNDPTTMREGGSYRIYVGDVHGRDWVKTYGNKASAILEAHNAYYRMIDSCVSTCIQLDDNLPLIQAMEEGSFI